MLICNLLKVSQKDQDLDRGLSMSTLPLTLMLELFFSNRPRMLCRTRGWPTGIPWGLRPPETEGPSNDVLMNFPCYTVIIILKSPRSRDFIPFFNMQCMYSHVFWMSLMHWNVPTYTCNDKVYLCLCIISPNKDRLDALLRDTLLWQWSLPGVSLIAGLKWSSYS